MVADKRLLIKIVTRVVNHTAIMKTIDNIGLGTVSHGVRTISVCGDCDASSRGHVNVN